MLRTSCFALLLALHLSPAQATPTPDPQLRSAFIEEAAKQHALDPADIGSWLDKARHQPAIVAAMSRPAEKVKPWHQYRPIFLGEQRIREGRAFLDENRALLDAVENQTGVPAEVIVAIIGVETSYGKITGNHRVLDALYTLGFFYPVSGDPERVEYEARRGLFFRKELAQAMRLAKDNGFDLDTLQGSYAGAMGWGQFMPSSYRNYAVDGDGDGRVDLFASKPDIFASVANYFVAHGWKAGQPVVAPATVSDDAQMLEAPPRLQVTHSLAELSALGYRPLQEMDADLQAGLVLLEGSAGPEHWLGFANFFVITRYNISAMYAMAVHQLSREIAGDEVVVAAAPQL
ncbi:MAG TPA: lytic murein transglycosylase B [Arenimonas sp.]|nr:lytic murein transglycosylase B [Arenimonas sp.]